MDDQQLNAYCYDWAHWAKTRRYFAPPVPANILAKMQPRDRAPREVDGPMDPDLCFFNMSVSRVAEDDPNGAACFSLFYYHQARNIKWLAAEMGISRKTFYNRMHAFGRLALKWMPTVKRVHLESMKELATVD